MNVAGRDCSLIIALGGHLVSLPYAEETMRNRYFLIVENPTLEGSGRAAFRAEVDGSTGCFVTRLTRDNVPILFAVAFSVEESVSFVSETRSLWLHKLTLDYVEPGTPFTLVSDRVVIRKRYFGLSCRAWELRIMREKPLYLKLDAEGESLSQDDYALPFAPLTAEEYFREETVTYRVNEEAAPSIYGAIVSVKRGSTPRAEIQLHRTMSDVDQALFTPWIALIEIEARLYHDEYEVNRKGRFVIRAENLILVSDETTVNCADEVIGPIRYVVAGDLTAEVFTCDGERLLP